MPRKEKHYIVAPTIVRNEYSDGPLEKNTGWAIGWSWKSEPYKRYEKGEKQDAVRRARELGKNQGRHVAIYKADGWLQKVWTNPDIQGQFNAQWERLAFIHKPPLIGYSIPGLSSDDIRY